MHGLTSDANESKGKIDRVGHDMVRVNLRAVLVDKEANEVAEDQADQQRM